jgi:hypothetical protein
MMASQFVSLNQTSCSFPGDVLGRSVEEFDNFVCHRGRNHEVAVRIGGATTQLTVFCDWIPDSVFCLLWFYFHTEFESLFSLAISLTSSLSSNAFLDS